jgi:hypothetical protein
MVIFLGPQLVATAVNPSLLKPAHAPATQQPQNHRARCSWSCRDQGLRVLMCPVHLTTAAPAAAERLLHCRPGAHVAALTIAAAPLAIFP